MNSREHIILQVKKNKPLLSTLPEIPTFHESENAVAAFVNNLKNIGGELIELDDLSDVQGMINKVFQKYRNIVSSTVINAIEVNEYTTKNVLEGVEVAVLKAELGIAENGAVWLSEKNMLNRALPFITQHLVILIKRSKIVTSMHHAYAKVTSPSYGCFIAGPSKTADIEQSLVIGAHGARSMTVILYTND